jgi:hypothetical protein
VVSTCRCDTCCPDAPAPTWTAAFRRDCLARYVAALPTLDDQRAFLDAWFRRHGKAATAALKDAVRRVWREASHAHPME